MAKVKWYTTCSKCNTKYHVSCSCCPNCELEEYWRNMAAYYQREAQKCIQTADQIAEAKVKGTW